MDDYWESLEQGTNQYIATVNELVESLRKFFGDLEKLIEDLAEAIFDQVRAELSRKSVKKHPPLKLIREYSFIPSAKKNLPYQRRSY